MNQSYLAMALSLQVMAGKDIKSMVCGSREAGEEEDDVGGWKSQKTRRRQRKRIRRTGSGITHRPQSNIGFPRFACFTATLTTPLYDTTCGNDRNACAAHRCHSAVTMVSCVPRSIWPMMKSRSVTRFTCRGDGLTMAA